MLYVLSSLVWSRQDHLPKRGTVMHAVHAKNRERIVESWYVHLNVIQTLKFWFGYSPRMNRRQYGANPSWIHSLATNKEQQPSYLHYDSLIFWYCSPLRHIYCRNWHHSTTTHWDMLHCGAPWAHTTYRGFPSRPLKFHYGIKVQLWQCFQSLRKYLWELNSPLLNQREIPSCLVNH